MTEIVKHQHNHDVLRFYTDLINPVYPMETLYNWLLLNTEDAGNYYTILNTQRNGPESLEVMARSSDFRIVNLFIQNTQNASPPAGQSDESSGKPSAKRFIFSDEQQVITYFAEGKTPDQQNPDSAVGIHILVTEPDGETGDITFPPVQT